MINFWKLAYEAVKEQRDQYKSERDTLIDDLKVLREKNEKLERELKKKSEDADRLGYRWRDSHDEAERLKRVNEKLRKQYTTLTDHIRLKASANPGEHRYIALVNFIDRLEKGEK